MMISTGEGMDHELGFQTALVQVLGQAALASFALAAIASISFVQAKNAPGLAKSEPTTRNQPRRFAIDLVAWRLFALATGLISTATALLIYRHGPGASSAHLLTSVLAWITIFAHQRFGMKVLAVFVAPLATLILLVRFLLQNDGLGGTEAPSSLLTIAHITLAVSGEAFAIIACGAALFYLWQQYLLKQKLFASMPRGLPTIDQLEKVLGASLWTGFVLITLGLVSGAFIGMADEQSLQAKVIWAILVWLWYLAILLAKNVFSRSSREIASMCLLGFVLLAGSYFGMGFFGVSRGGTP